MSNRVSLPYGTTIEVRDTCLCLHLQRAARAVARRFDELMRPAGLTSGQFSLLMSLNRPEPPTMRAVAELLAMDRTTLTANLKPLERRSLVRIKIDQDDRRSRRLVLTAFDCDTDQGFDVALHIVFTNKAAHDKYQEAESHKQFIEENKENWKKVRVFDAKVLPANEK